MTRRLKIERPVLIGAGLIAASFVIYWFCAREFDAGTPVYVKGLTAAQLKTALKLP